MSEISSEAISEASAQLGQGIREINCDCRQLDFLDSLPGSESTHCNTGCQMCPQTQA